MTPERILIFRLGSIGDVVISLPCLNAIRQRFPSARIHLLTSKAPDARAAAAEAVLAGSGLVDGYIEYQLSTRSFRELGRIRSAVRQFAPDLLIYLAAPRGTVATWRDYLFFLACGPVRSIGFPFSRDRQFVRPPAAEGGLWEREAHRLARCMAGLAAIDVERPETWDLHLTPAEQAEAETALAPLVSATPPTRFVAISLGTKQAINDWGDDNWRNVLARLSDARLGLVLIGADGERQRSDALAEGWSGPVLNLCGRLSPRGSAAVIAQARLFLCHDSGPMHLAAAVGTSCVAVFSRLNPPGKWFPYGDHRIFYPPGDGDTIAATRPAPVIAAAKALLAEASQPAL